MVTNAALQVSARITTSTTCISIQSWLRRTKLKSNFRVTTQGRGEELGEKLLWYSSLAA